MNEKTYELPSGDERILLVEDNAEVQSVTVEMLAQLGYRVIGVDSADKAIELLSTRADIGLVISDIVMPGQFDGLALARRLREQYPDIPVLLTTGYAKAVLGAFSEFPILRKPYQLPALAQVVRNAIDKHKA